MEEEVGISIEDDSCIVEEVVEDDGVTVVVGVTGTTITRKLFQF
jgi:predicted methyltransferase MtxX (methanogen marker protein 4)